MLSRCFHCDRGNNLRRSQSAAQPRARGMAIQGRWALSQYNKLTRAGSHKDNRLSLLLVCKVPQGSKIEVPGSGYRTAFSHVCRGKRRRLRTNGSDWNRQKSVARCVESAALLIWVKVQRGKLLDETKGADGNPRRPTRSRHLNQWRTRHASLDSRCSSGVRSSHRHPHSR